jgi:hypothetical protein
MSERWTFLSVNESDLPDTFEMRAPPQHARLVVGRQDQVVGTTQLSQLCGQAQRQRAQSQARVGRGRGREN